MAPGCPFRLCGPGDRLVGTVGRGQPDRRRAAGGERVPVRLEPGAAAREPTQVGAAAPPVAYAVPLHPIARVPAALNGFALWNVLVLVLMIVAYAWPIAQFAVYPSPGAVIHRVGGAG